MAFITKSLTMPDGNEFEFLGKTYYGTCNTAAGTAAKVTNNITGFTSADLVAGAHISVKFSYKNTATGIPTLNVAGTGAKSIYIDTSTPAENGEWTAGEVLDFVYDGTNWVIVGRNRAATDAYGVTKLSSTIANDATTALTPKAVYDAGYLTLADLPIYDGTVT